MSHFPASRSEGAIGLRQIRAAKSAAEMRMSVKTPRVSKDAKKVSKLAQDITSGKYSFHHRQCSTFVAKGDEVPTGFADAKCQCGAPASQHTNENSSDGTSWTFRENTVEHPTNAFGTIKFGNHKEDKSAPYVRVSPTDSPDAAVDFVRDMLFRKGQKKYKTPSLIISVTGGARNFSLPQRLINSIRKGLIQAADSTDAWVITGGTQSGVMKLIGEIMADTAYERPVPIIGIATWGILGSTEMLTGKRLEDRLDVKYDAKDGIGLDPNHNMFLLVDDGSTMQFGREIAFRAAFEASASKIAVRDEAASASSQAGEDQAKELTIPIVTIIIQGGPGSLETAHDAIMAGTPLVVVEGTGQAADMLAYAWHFLHGNSRAHQAKTTRDIKKMIERSWTTKPELVEKYMVQIFECVDDADKVVISSFSSGSGDIDVAILKAVFRGSSSALRANLRQAMRWNRLDIARQALVAAFRTPEGEQKHGDALNDNLMWALKHNNPAFVELFLEFGAQAHLLRPTDPALVTSKNSVNLQRAIMELYRSAGKDRTSHIHYLLHICDKRLHHSRSKKKNHKTSPTDPNDKDISMLAVIHEFLAHRVSDKFTFEPAFEKLDEEFVTDTEKRAIASHALLFWAVALDKFRLAHKFWHMGDQSMPNALVASRLLDSLAKHDMLNRTHLVDEREKMKYNSKKFETLAVGVLEQCHSSDSRKSALMLSRPIPQYSDNTCVQIAYQADNKEFISHPASQSVINSLWMGSLGQRSRWWKVALCVLFPLLVPFFISFRRSVTEYSDEDVHNEEDDIDEMADDEEHSSRDKVHYNIFQRFSRFYTAPITRFWIDCLAFVALLLLYSYVLLDELNDSISIIEYILLVWFCSMFLEESRQIITDGPKEYFEDVWNRLDALIIVLYFASFGARAHNTDAVENLIYFKTLGAINTLCLWVRLARYYAVSETLGPKLLMMQRMAGDVMTFLGLLAVFLISFGIATQSLLFPDRPFDFHTFVGIFYRPYFQIFGELQLDTLEEDSDCIGPTPFSSCGWKASWLTPILLAVYLLFTNILLVNLLIAMFNQTYVDVQESARQLWNMQNYELYKEYRNKPVLPLPLITLNHAYMIYKACQCKPDAEHDDNEDLNHTLHVFQETNTDKYVHKWRQQQSKEVAEQLATVSTNLRDINSSLNELQDQNATLRHMVERMGERPATLAHNVSVVNVSEPASPTKLHSDETDETYRPPLQYPMHDDMNGVAPPLRFPVPADKVSWRVPFPEYAPVEYTAPFVLIAKWADPPSTLPDFAAPDRQSYVCNILKQLNEFGMPVNPMGRTGMTGRGVLGKYGVNHAVDPIVTRWKRNAQGDIVYRENKRVLEFVAIRRKMGGKEWAIPGGFVERGETVSRAMQSEFKEEALNEEGMTPDEREHAAELVAELFANGRLVKQAYSRDPRNTDNAWIETAAWHFHDETGLGVGKFKLEGGDDADKAKWRMVHRYQYLFASHREFISMVAQSLGAYW